MTAVVGLWCRDGVVIGTDSAATLGTASFRTVEQPIEKLEVVENRVVIAGVGSVGHGQRFRVVVEERWAEGPPVSEVGFARDLSAGAVRDFQTTKTPRGAYGALVAFPCAERAVLCRFDSKDFQPELVTSRLWYCSMGSAQAITDPFLALMREVFWREGPPTVHQGAFVVTWALDHAIAVNPGGVNGPVRLAVLRNDSSGPVATLLDSDALDSHRALIEDLKGALRSVPLEPRVDGAGPEVPQPETP